MTRTIIDLDVLVPEDKVAVLGGVTYALPGDMPMELYLKLQRASADDIDESEATLILYDGIFDLFATGLDEGNGEGRTKLKRTLDSLGVRSFMRLFSEIYKEDEVDEVADPTSPPKLTVIQGGEDGTASTNSPTTTTSA